MRLLSLICMLAVLSACTPALQQKPQNSPETLWQQRLPELTNISPWAFRGRTAIVQNREGFNAGIDWSEHETRYLIKLSGPFAQGGAELKGQAHNVVLTLDTGETYSAETPEALLIKAMGWQLPVSALRDWIRGMPYAALPVVKKTLDDQGRLLTLQQGDWSIQYKKYIPFERYSMPGKVFIRHPQLSVKLMIDDWRRP